MYEKVSVEHNIFFATLLVVRFKEKHKRLRYVKEVSWHHSIVRDSYCCCNA